jgi:hypothetical protein
MNFAWNQFGQIAHGLPLVQAICDIRRKFPWAIPLILSKRLDGNQTVRLS